MKNFKEQLLKEIDEINSFSIVHIVLFMGLLGLIVMLIDRFVSYQTFYWYQTIGDYTRYWIVTAFSFVCIGPLLLQR